MTDPVLRSLRIGGPLLGATVICAIVPGPAGAAEDGTGAMVMTLILPALAFALGALLLIRSRRR
ncbi:MAG: hypothetical protein AAF416_12680 [Pseudomonadota bacterium]